MFVFANEQVYASSMFIDRPTQRTCGDGSPALSASAAGDTAGASHAAGVADAKVFADAVGGVDLGALSNSSLEDRVVGLVALRARVGGEYLAATLDALKAGEIHTSHARVIAREAPKKHRRSEAQFLELCRAYTSDTVARHPLAYESEQVYADLEAEAAAQGLSPIDAELALQRQQRSGSMSLGDDGMWDLRAKLDYITGRQLSAMLQAAVRSPRHRAADNNINANSGIGVEPTRAQLTADAISELIAGKLNVRQATTSLLIVADYDIVNDRLTNPASTTAPPCQHRCSPTSPSTPTCCPLCSTPTGHRPRSGEPQRQRRPTAHPRRTRQRLHRLRAHQRAHPSPPHPILRKRRPNGHSEPRIALRDVPFRPARTRPTDPHPTPRPTLPAAARTKRHRPAWPGTSQRPQSIATPTGRHRPTTDNADTQREHPHPTLKRCSYVCQAAIWSRCCW